MNIYLTSGAGIASEHGILGGPDVEAGGAGVGGLAVLEAFYPTVMSGTHLEDDDNIAGFILLDNAMLASTGSLFGDATSNSGNVLVYKVQAGDTVPKIAANFGISADTILWANVALRDGRIRVGEELVILPVSGVLYKTKGGEAVRALASLFGVDAKSILTVNKINDQESLDAGRQIIIPGGKPKKLLVNLASWAPDPSLPNILNYFSFPAPKNSHNWGELHANNAVDISNACGSPIYASADGFVSRVGSPVDWNSGYGGLVELEHPNGTRTLYAHTQDNLVQSGDIVSVGDKIAKIGNSGNVKGLTGCHVHFEIYGAKNPFAK